MLGDGAWILAAKSKSSRTEQKTHRSKQRKLLTQQTDCIKLGKRKTLPDIVSVLRMSDLYGVSLDYLLKGEVSMKDYLDYVEESTNVVKSKVRLSKLILILSYLVIWALNIAVSWRFSADSITEAQAGAFQWLVLPGSNDCNIYFDWEKQLLGKA